MLILFSVDPPAFPTSPPRPIRTSGEGIIFRHGMSLRAMRLMTIRLPAVAPLMRKRHIRKIEICRDRVRGGAPRHLVVERQLIDTLDLSPAPIADIMPSLTKQIERNQPVQAIHCSPIRHAELSPISLGHSHSFRWQRGVGFEPTDLSASCFRDRHLQPLGHPSIGADPRSRTSNLPGFNRPLLPLELGRHGTRRAI